MIGNKRPTAIACVRGGETYPNLRGTVEFAPLREGTLVTAKIEGLPDSETGFFAMHIHEKGDCSEAGFPDTGGHYDPHDREHPLHAGDLPPLLSCKGRAYLAVVTGRFCVKDVVGRTVVIHSRPDDFTTQPAGNAGSKIACGIIRSI